MTKKNKRVAITINDLRPQAPAVDALAARAIDQDHQYRMQALNNNDSIRREQAARYRDLDLEQLKNARQQFNADLIKSRMDKEQAAEERLAQQRNQTQKDIQRTKTIASYHEFQITKLAAEKEAREAKADAIKELLGELRKSEDFKARKQAREDAIIMAQLRKEEEVAKLRLINEAKAADAKARRIKHIANIERQNVRDAIALKKQRRVTVSLVVAVLSVLFVLAAYY